MKKVIKNYADLTIRISLMTIMFILLTSNAFSQFNLNKLKDKVKSEEKTSTEATQIPAVSGDEYKKMAEYYGEKLRMLGSYPFVFYNFGNMVWTENDIAEVEKFNMTEVLQRMKEDKEKHPELFKVYMKDVPTSGYNAMTQSTVPAFADKVDASFPLRDDDARKVNEFYCKYVYWKQETDAKRRELAACLQKLIAKTDEVMESQKIETAQLAYRGIQAAKTLKPDHPMMDDLMKAAKQSLDKTYSKMGDMLTGEFHKMNLKKIVGFTSEPKIGSENASAVSNVIVPGKPFYIVGYFSGYIKDLDLVSNASGLPVRQAPTLFWREKGTNGLWNYQRFYSNSERMEQQYKNQSYFMVNLFPDPDKTNFASHLEYVPYLNIAKWMTYQLPGEYEFDFAWYNGAAYDKNGFAAGTFKIAITQADIDNIKTYFDKLLNKKIQSVTFNNQWGCANMKGKIGKEDQMKKYGELLKVTVTETNKVMRPWPNEHIVNNYVGLGYGAFKRSDGKYEIISVGFTRDPKSKTWDFSTVHIPSEYELYGDFPVKTIILDYGYEMNKEGIEKCAKW